ncbi:MAG TPA: FG-GAP-like repeat-containing protein [Candidatus Acidoferrum sp.]|nr:FG-GAP-like repeat-containing protein [Candidatus Acidoferrum sp.]
MKLIKAVCLGFMAASAVAVIHAQTPPVITGFAPIAGAVGTNVAIAGTNFSPVASNNIVHFGAVRAAVTAASVTNLTVTVPAGATYAPITETVNGLVAYAPAAFAPTFAGDGSALSASSFGPRVDLAGGSGSALTAIADLDGDGKPDLVVVNGYDGNLSLFRNISTSGTLNSGSFAPRVDLPAFATTPGSLAVADVDGDGKLDVVVTDYGNNRVLVYRNVSTVGTLTTNSLASPVAFTAGNSPVAVRVMDLDGDGKPDLAWLNYGDNTLAIRRNIGTAGSLTTNSFAAPVLFATGNLPHDLAIVDLDGDGKPDLAEVNYVTGYFLSVFRNVSVPGVLNTSSFAPRVDFSASGMGDSIIAGDVDGDGKPDLVVAWAIGSATAVYRNLSSPGSFNAGSLAPEVDFSAPGWVRSLGLGDINGDGKPDLGLTCEVDSFMCFFQNLSAPGSFTSSSLGGRVDFGAGWNPHGMSIGDLDGDGRPDVVFGNQYDSTVSIYQNLMPFAEPPSITAQPQDALVNAHDNAAFSVTATGSAPLSYRWSLNHAGISDATNDVLSLFNVKQSDLGGYQVVVTNVYGAVTSSVAQLMMYPYIAAPFSGVVTYWGSDTTLSVGAWGTSPLSYQWYQNGVALSGATNATLSLGAIQFTNAGLYYVVVSSTLGNATNATYEVVVNPANVSLGLFPGVIISGTIGYHYVIQGTTNLGDTNSWTTLTNLTLSQPLEVWNDNSSDVTRPGNPQRYYRVLPGQ